MRSLWADRPYPFLGYRAPTLSSDGRTLAVIVLSERAEGGADRSISIRVSATGTNCVDIRCESESSVEELLFSADGSLLLSRTIGRRVLKFDVESGEAKGALVHPGRAFVTGMAVHPRGALACSRSNGSICFWDLRKSEPTRILDWKLGKLVSVAFSPDGSIGAAGTEDGQVIVWDVDE
jgi:WD40 repeat protein